MKTPPWRRHAIVAAIAAIGMLIACATLTPSSIDAQLDAANHTVTAIEQATDAALTAHLITAPQARAVSTIAHQINPLIDAAHAAVAVNNPTSANQTLNLINSLLAGLQAYVPSAPPPTAPK